MSTVHSSKNHTLILSVNCQVKQPLWFIYHYTPIYFSHAMSYETHISYTTLYKHVCLVSNSFGVENTVHIGNL